MDKNAKIFSINPSIAERIEEGGSTVTHTALSYPKHLIAILNYSIQQVLLNAKLKAKYFLSIKSFIMKPFLFCIFYCFTLMCSAKVPFITTWKTDNPGVSDSTSVTIPTHSGHTYKYDVDWNGDGIYDEFEITGSVTHDYRRVVTTQIAIRGTFPRIYFNNGGDKDKILSIDQWGDQKWENLNSAFRGCENLVETATDAPDLSIVASMSQMFQEASNFNGDLSNWDVSKVPWMISTFLNASSFNGDITTWQLDSCNSIRYMFNGASSFNQDISGWDVSNMATLQHTFHDATAFDQDLGDWDISAVTDMTSMFDDSGMSRSNYDKTLIGWGSQAPSLQIGVNLGVNNLEYCNGINERLTLLTEQSWNIVGDMINCSDATFVTTWTTDNPGSSNATSLSIPTSTSCDYNYDVDWENDGTFDTIGVSGSITHDYGVAGTYQVAIRGNFGCINFPNTNSGDADKIININQWGEIGWETMASSYIFCDSLEYSATDAPDLSGVTDIGNMFRYCAKFNGDIGNWDVGHIKNMAYMFNGCSMFNQDISSWEVDSVNDMSGMFYRASSFNQNLSTWQVGNVTDMKSMFQEAASFNGEIGMWDVSKVTDMARMFAGNSTTSNIFNQALDWDVRNVTDMKQMFEYNSSFNQDLHMWEPEKATDMHRMFAYCPVFDGNISNWNVLRVTDMAGMFREAVLFNKDLYWDVDSVMNMEGMFYKASLFNGDITNWNVQMVENMAEMFRDAESFNKDLYWDVDSVIDMRNMFYRATLFNGDISEWKVNNVEDMLGMFREANSFNQDISEWKVGKVTDMSFMFNDATAFNQDLNDWDVGKVLSMRYMFSSADSFNQDLNEWDVDSVKNMTRMFSATALFNGDISNWQTDSVTDMSYMFSVTDAFNQDISSWNTSKVTNMERMFWSADQFNQDLSEWDVSNVTDAEKIFQFAYHFDQNLEDWNISNMTNMTDMLSRSGLSTANYDSTLIGWSSRSVQPGITLVSEDLTYCSGAMARAALIASPNNWTITEDEENCIDILPCMTTTVNRWLYNQSDSWNTAAPQRWTLNRIPTICDEVITKSGNLITIPSNRKAECFSLDVVPNSEFEIEIGGILEVWAEQP